MPIAIWCWIGRQDWLPTRLDCTWTNVKSDGNRVANSFLNAKYDYWSNWWAIQISLDFVIEIWGAGCWQGNRWRCADPLIWTIAVEYQLLQLSTTLKWNPDGYLKNGINLPELSSFSTDTMFGNYLQFLISPTYTKVAYPVCSCGTHLSIPIFQGGKNDFINMKSGRTSSERGNVELKILAIKLSDEYSAARAIYTQ